MTVNIFKNLNIFHFLFSNKMSVIKARIHQMHVRIANKQNHDQTATKQSDLGPHCLSSHFGRQLVFEILEYLL